MGQGDRTDKKGGVNLGMVLGRLVREVGEVGEGREGRGGGANPDPLHRYSGQILIL